MDHFSFPASFWTGMHALTTDYVEYLDDYGFRVAPVGTRHLTKSPIERILCAAIAMTFALDQRGIIIGDAEAHFALENCTVHLIPQFVIDCYTVDFALMPYGSKAVKIVVECDGHAFHEKTKEQVAKDKKREREIVARGWKMLRFSGSEIHRDAFACAGEVRDQFHDDWCNAGARGEFEA